MSHNLLASQSPCYDTHYSVGRCMKFAKGNRYRKSKGQIRNPKGHRAFSSENTKPAWLSVTMLAKLTMHYMQLSGMVNRGVVSSKSCVVNMLCQYRTLTIERPWVLHLKCLPNRGRPLFQMLPLSTSKECPPLFTYTTKHN